MKKVEKIPYFNNILFIKYGIMRINIFEVVYFGKE
jgi:hypothetical protein